MKSFYSIAAIAFIFSAPFFNGLYYKLSFFIFMSILLLITAVSIVDSRNGIFSHILFVPLFFQLAISILTAFSAVNKEEAVYGIFINLLAPCIIWLVLKTGNSEETPPIFVAYFLSASLIAFDNFILAYIFHRGTNTSVRLDSVIPYANTQGLFFFIGAVSGLFVYKLFVTKNTAIRGFVLWGVMLCNTAMILTYSRTLWILSVPLYGLFFFLNKKREMLIFLPAILLSMVCAGSISASRWIWLWPSLLISLILLQALVILMDKLPKQFFIKEKKLSRVIPKVLFISFITFLLLCILAVIFRGTPVMQRLLSITAGATEFRERLQYYKDAFSIIKDHLFSGIGRGGWESLQYQYQTSLYSTKFVHSSVVQMMLDYGIAGLLIILMQWGIFIKLAVSAMKKQLSNIGKNAIIAVILCNSGILLHSLIDIDFEFPVKSLIFWVNTAILALYSKDYIKKKVLYLRLKIPIFAGALIALFLLAVLMISEFFYVKGLESFNCSRYNVSQQELGNSIIINPFACRAWYLKAEGLKKMYLEKPDKEISSHCLKAYDNAQALDSYNPKYYAGKAYIYAISGDFDKSANEYQQLINAQPLISDYYDALSDVLLKNAIQEIEQGNESLAKADLTKIISIEAQMKAKEKGISKDAYKLKHKVDLKLSFILAERIGTAYALLKNPENALKYLTIAYYGDKKKAEERLKEIIKQ